MSIDGSTPAEKKIIASLEKSSKSVTDISSDANLAKGTVSDIVDKFEKEAKVKRCYDSETKKILIELSDELQDPVATTLRHLSAASPIVYLDLERGRKLLTDEVIEGVKELAQYELTTEYEVEIRELNEVCLLKALSRYYTERYLIRELFQAPDIFNDRHPDLARHLSDVFFSEEKKIDIENLRDFYEKNNENQGILPALSIARERRIGYRLDEIVNWIHPLLEELHVVEKEGEEKTKGFEIMFTPNLAASLFWSQVKVYLVTLFGEWHSKMEAGNHSE